MSESLNMSLEHRDENDDNVVGSVLPKLEPCDNPVDVKPNIEQLAKKGPIDSRKKGDESDFDPTNLTEEEDPSIPEDEDASFASYVGGKGNKRNKSKHLYSTYQRVPSRPYAAAQRNYESEDDNFSALPRQRLSRSCKNPAVRPILDIDIPSSSSPEEFDESIHVMSKAYKLELEAKKAKEIAAKSPGAVNEKIETELVKEEPQENMQMGSPSKKMKEEPAEHDDK